MPQSILARRIEADDPVGAKMHSTENLRDVCPDAPRPSACRAAYFRFLSEPVAAATLLWSVPECVYGHN
jgi:hypothetical protein